MSSGSESRWREKDAAKDQKSPPFQSHQIRHYRLATAATGQAKKIKYALYGDADRKQTIFPTYLFTFILIIFYQYRFIIAAYSNRNNCCTLILFGLLYIEENK